MQKKQSNNVDTVSLNKYISSTGFCSRRQADDYIQQGRVTINDKTAQTGERVTTGDNIAIDGELLKKSKKQITLYMAFNKPVGVTTTTDPKDKTNIISYINYPKRIFPVGRLDKDSDGLILLTNDGDIVNKILRAGNYHEKEYIVTVDKAITPDFISQMGSGVPVLGKITNACAVKQEGNKRFRIILTQGMNRQIRRMCQHLGYKVITLTRIRIMNIRLGKMPVGTWRLLTNTETEEMTRMIASSSKTEEASKRPAKEQNFKKTIKTPSNFTDKKKIQNTNQSNSAKQATTRQRKPQDSKKGPDEKPRTGTKKTKSYKDWRNKR